MATTRKRKKRGREPSSAPRRRPASKGSKAQPKARKGQPKVRKAKATARRASKPASRRVTPKRATGLAPKKTKAKSEPKKTKRELELEAKVRRLEAKLKKTKVAEFGPRWTAVGSRSKEAAKAVQEAAEKLAKKAIRKAKAKAKAKQPGWERDERGRFISDAQAKRIERRKALEKIERAEKLREERIKRQNFPIDLPVYRRLRADLNKVASYAVRPSGLEVEATSELSGAAFDGMVEITGLPPALIRRGKRKKLDPKLFAKARKKILDSLLEAQKAIRARPGMLVAVTLVPEETILTMYGRGEQPIMTTRWLRTDTPEMGQLISRTRRMLDSLLENEWEIQKLQIKFRYDHEVAMAGQKKSRNKPVPKGRR